MEPSPSQPTLVRRFFRWLFSWRTARRGVVTFAVLATLVALFCTEENWRGKRDWENCKRALEAKGETLDWSAFIPPPVPDDQNFFTAPKMDEWFVRRTMPGTYVITSSSNELTGELSLPAFAEFEKSRRPDVTFAVANLPLVFTNREEAADYQEWISRADPRLDLIRSALQRPAARINGDYDRPYERPGTVNFVAMRILAQHLASRAESHLTLGQPEKAVEDLAFIHDLKRVLDGRPNYLVPTMIEVAIAGLYTSTLADGLRQRAWREPELIALQKQLGEIDLPPLFSASMRSERAGVCETIESSTIGKRSEMSDLYGAKVPFWKRLGNPRSLEAAFMLRGWIYENLVVIAQLSQNAVDTYDPKTGCVFPQKPAQAVADIEKNAGRSPFYLFAAMLMPDFNRAAMITALDQTKVNEALIACGLERYRLAHHDYPETLDVLVPQYLDKIPHDLIGGQPLHYQRTDADHFTLYSVGWNETDDGGKTVSDKDAATGDWVWDARGK